jgi:hypothetical protein
VSPALIMTLTTSAASMFSPSSGSLNSIAILPFRALGALRLRSAYSWFPAAAILPPPAGLIQKQANWSY